jgi:(S)-ureidoglycine---glyoxylate transaminase
MDDELDLNDELNPPPRLLMGPGPINCDPRVLHAMAMPPLGHSDPVFWRYMDQTMALLRRLFETRNRWSFLVNGSARAGIEGLMISIIAPGDRVLVPIFGRFGHLLTEIAERCGGDVRSIRVDWGAVFSARQLETAIEEHRPKLVALVHGDTSTTMAQPLDRIGAICRRSGALLFVDATATLGGMPFRTDEWQVDAVAAGLQKCLSGPPGIAPVTLNERVVEAIRERRHIESGIAPAGFQAPSGPRIQSNYLDIPMLMDWWSDTRLPHHTEATAMLYAARECARIVLKEGLENSFERHRVASEALAAGLQAMGLELFGDQEHKMPNATGVIIPAGIDGEAVRGHLLTNFGIEIGTSFGPLRGKIWRIGTMGYNCRRQNVLICLAALETALLNMGFEAPAGRAVQTALGIYGRREPSGAAA